MATVVALRQHTMATVVGAPGSGKTTLVDVLARRYRAGGGAVTILDPNGTFARRDGAVWPVDGDADAWLVRFKAARIAELERARAERRAPPMRLLVLDDADRYLAGGPPTGIFRDLFTSFRHWQIDVVTNERRPQDVPKVIFASSENVYVFRLLEPYGADYLERAIGPEIRGQIPTQKYEYIRINRDTREVRKGRTEARRTRSVSPESAH